METRKEVTSRIEIMKIEKDEALVRVTYGAKVDEFWLRPGVGDHMNYIVTVVHKL